MSLQLTEFSVIREKGPRPEMQDALVAQQGPDGGAYHFGVFDGHNPGGELFAQLAADEIEDLTALAGGLPVLETVRIARSQLRGLDRKLRAKIPRSVGGTTATVAALEIPDLAIAWMGDSEAAFFPDAGKTVRLVKPHDTNHAGEIERAAAFPDGALEDVNGHSYFGGKLAVSRAVGDFHCGFAVAETDIVQYEIREPGFLVVASDGVWGRTAASHATVEDIVRYGNPNDTEAVAETLGELAWRTNDNASAIVARIE